jgi:hypothetical protein
MSLQEFEIKDGFKIGDGGSPILQIKTSDDVVNEGTDNVLLTEKAINKTITDIATNSLPSTIISGSIIELPGTLSNDMDLGFKYLVTDINTNIEVGGCEVGSYYEAGIDKNNDILIADLYTSGVASTLTAYVTYNVDGSINILKNAVAPIGLANPSNTTEFFATINFGATAETGQLPAEILRIGTSDYLYFGFNGSEYGFGTDPNNLAGASWNFKPGFTDAGDYELIVHYNGTIIDYTIKHLVTGEEVIITSTYTEDTNFIFLIPSFDELTHSLQYLQLVNYSMTADSGLESTCVGYEYQTINTINNNTPIFLAESANVGNNNTDKWVNATGAQVYLNVL